MTPKSVVKRLDVSRYVGAHYIASSRASPMHAFLLQTVEEALAQRVAPANAAVVA